MKIKSPTNNRYHQRPPPLQSYQKLMMFATLFLAALIASIFINRESNDIHSVRVGKGGSFASRSASIAHHDSAHEHAQQEHQLLQQNTAQSSSPYYYHTQKQPNKFSLSPGELPGYTGWARPEQTLAGYFDITSLSHPQTHGTSVAPLKYHSIVKSGDTFSLLITCNHNSTTGSGVDEEEEEEEAPYMCPSDGGTLFYVRAYGPSVITGLVTDHYNASYTVEMQFVDPGEYTLEVVVTFSVPLEFDEFPLNLEPPSKEEEDKEEEEEGAMIEPGYEGYMVSGFPLSIRVDAPMSTLVTEDGKKRKPWCTVDQLTESTPQTALYKGHWQVIDNVARSSHQPLTPDETMVTLDGYRMGLNSVGVRMSYEYEDCDLIHIRDIIGGIKSGMDKCLAEQFGFTIQVPDVDVDGMNDNITDAGIYPLSSLNNEADEFEGVHIIFIGDSVMKLVMGFFRKLVNGSFGIKVTFIETNGGIHQTMANITVTLKEIQQREKDKNIKRVILFNTGLHDIDVLCSSKRSSTRDKNDLLREGQSCSDAYREALVKLVRFIDEYPASLKVFRSTTSGKSIYCFSV